MLKFAIIYETEKKKGGKTVKVMAQWPQKVVAEALYKRLCGLKNKKVFMKEFNNVVAEFKKKSVNIP